MLRTRLCALALVVVALVAGCGDDDDAAGDAAVDGGVTDAMADAGMTPDAATLLSQSGLFADIAAKTISPGHVEYSPAYPLYSDGAEKRRWLWLPPGTKIDTSDMDHWSYPVGTRLFKEFKLGGKLIETRIMEKLSSYEWRFMPYYWRDDGSDADLLEAGLLDVPGTNGYDIPPAARCNECHRGAADKVLGFTAIQLSKPGSGSDQIFLKSATVRALLTAPPPADTDYPVPGNPVESLALGVLHANCGHCHNPGSNVFGTTNQELKLSVGERTVAATATYRTTVKKMLSSWNVGDPNFNYRIDPGQHAKSGIWFRMSVRGNNDQMPPRRLTSDLVYQGGLDAVAAWIDSLPPNAP